MKFGAGAPSSAAADLSPNLRNRSCFGIEHLVDINPRAVLAEIGDVSASQHGKRHRCTIDFPTATMRTLTPVK